MKAELLLFLAIAVISCKTVPRETVSVKEPIALFNGRDLNGWTTYGKEKWYVENGFLVCENGPEEGFGYLGTNESYQNFELNLEFKQYTNGNGGVFVHSAIDGPSIKGWQVEIGAPGHHTGGIHVYDRGWLVKPDAVKDEALKMGEWNQLKITVDGDKMTVWLNSTEMVSLVDPKMGAGTGRIALQINQGDVTRLQWRNIEILAHGASNEGEY